MTPLYWLIGIIAIIGVGFFGWAMALPKEASATRTALIEAPVDKVFTVVMDVGNQSSWRSDVGTVEISENGTSWVENTTQGIEIAFQEEKKEPGLYVISYTSPQGFTGHWEGRFVDEDGATRVNIIETTRTEGLVARAMARIFAPAGAHIDLYLNDLEKAVATAD